MKTAQTNKRFRIYDIRFRNLLLGSFFLILISLILNLSSLPSAHAQENQRTITIVPPSIDLKVNPGDHKEGVLKVINDSDGPLTFIATMQDFIVSDTKGTPNLLPPNSLSKKYSASAWIGIVPDRFTVLPHQKALLNYYLQVPSDARPGGHYAAVIYTPSTGEKLQGSGASIQTQIGTLFSLDVSGNIHEEAVVSKFLAEHGFYEYGPVSILTQIKNLGDLHIKPLGVIKIYDILGRNIITVPLDEHNIFPGAARDFANVMGQTWMFGPFHAKFVASYGRNGNLPLTASMTFWVLPWKVMIVIILLIVASVMGYFVWKKKNTEDPPHHSEEHSEPNHAEEKTS